MLHIERTEGNFLEYRVSGHLSGYELQKYYALLDRRYQQHGQLHLLVSVRAFSGYAGPKALWVFLTNEHKLLGRVSRYAAVTDIHWFRHALGVLNRITPGLSIRVFPEGAREQALAWLDQKA